MLALTIIAFILSFVIYVLGGIVCGRLTVEIVRKKSSESNEVMWFWCGFFLNFFGLLATKFIPEDKE